MKARNPSTGQLDTVYVKALDSMPVGTIVDFDGTDIPTGWEEVEEYLWTNSNPTSNFASQNITLSDDNYNYYEVVYSQGTDDIVYLTTGKIPKGKGCFLQSVVGVSGGALVRGRTITYTNDTTLNVGDCRQAIGTSSASATNEYLIPVYVRRYN